MDRTHRGYLTRIGPLGGVLLMLVIAVFVAVGGLLLFGALLLWLPLLALFLLSAPSPRCSVRAGGDAEGFDRVSSTVRRVGY